MAPQPTTRARRYAARHALGIDPLADLLDGPRARNAFLLRSVLDPPWALRIRDEAALTLMATVQGHAYVMAEDGDPIRMQPGDVAIARGPDPYTVADDPQTAPQIVIHPGQRCATPEGEPLDQAMDLGVRTWGTGLDGATMLVTGTYEFAGEISRRLLGALPPLLVLEARHADAVLTNLLATEIVKDAPGQEAVLDRLLDLLLISTLRAWFSRPEAQAPTWYRAYGDPVVGRAVRMLQNNPEHPWTVASLAEATNVSRAALARRFNDLVGQPPMTFLTGWRIDLAADLLCETDAPISAVAEQVGYGSPFALSTAFKRVMGASPQQHRAQARAHATAA